MGFVTNALGITSPDPSRVYAPPVPTFNSGFNAGVYDSAYANNPGLLSQRQDLVNALRTQANGQGPSVSGQYLQNAMDENAAMQTAVANSQRGASNPGLAQRIAAENIANTNSKAIGAGAMMKTQEQLNAQGELGGIINQGIGMNNQLMSNQMGGATSAYGSQVGGQAGEYNTQSSLANATANRGANAVGGFLNAAGAVAAMAEGGKVPGRAQVSGDSSKNDKVPAMLSPGEIVVPRSKAQDPEKAKDFIDHLMKQRRGKNDEGEGYAKVLAAHRKLKDRVAKLEKKVS